MPTLNPAVNMLPQVNELDLTVFRHNNAFALSKVDHLSTKLPILLGFIAVIEHNREIIEFKDWKNPDKSTNERLFEKLMSEQIYRSFMSMGRGGYGSTLEHWLEKKRIGWEFFLWKNLLGICWGGMIFCKLKKQ